MQSFFSKKETLSRKLSDTKANSPKIALFYKASMVGVTFLTVSTIGVFSYPHTASASFLGDILGNIVGNTTQAAPIPSISNNSQTVPLLESNLTPELKNTVTDLSQGTVGEQAIETSEGVNNGPDIEKYATSASIRKYVVKKGDSIESIARKLKVSKDTIAYAADLDKGESLKIGQVLAVIPVDVPVEKTDKVEKADKTDKTKQIAEKADKKKEVAVVVPEKPKKVASAPVVDDESEKPTAIPAPVSPVSTLDTDARSSDNPVNTQPVDPGTPTGKPSGTISSGYIWPFPAGVGRISQGLHGDNAYDFAAPKGTPIYAIHDGTVLIAHPSGYNGGYGLYVVIDFTDGRQAIFGHMSKVMVEPGDVVKQGDVIGLVGSTGHSTGPHAHIGFHGTMGNPYLGLKVNATDFISND
jgi:murein DD-endopeptidase MepM/ murein hydrolase activator NlpD